MNFQQAIKRMVLGARIQNRTWPDGVYLAYNKREQQFGIWITVNNEWLRFNYDVSHKDLASDNWYDPAE